MLDLLYALGPVFLTIMTGYGLAVAGVFKPMFWRGAERLTYFVLFPALLFTTLAQASFDLAGILPMAGAMAAAILAITLALLVVRPALLIRAQEFTSLLQGSIRFNTYIGLAIVTALFGGAGLGAAAAAIALIVPLGNLISILALLRYGVGRRGDAGSALVKLISNPLVLSCGLGFAFNMSGLQVPPVLDGWLEILAQGALPLGLLSVGAGLELAVAAAGGMPLILACIVKLAALPAATYFACRLLGVESVLASVAILFNALPTAPSAFVLARQMGGAPQLMASIITLQVVLAAITLPAVILLLRQFL